MLIKKTPFTSEGEKIVRKREKKNDYFCEWSYSGFGGFPLLVPSVVYGVSHMCSFFCLFLCLLRLVDSHEALEGKRYTQE